MESSVKVLGRQKLDNLTLVGYDFGQTGVFSHLKAPKGWHFEALRIETSATWGAGEKSSTYNPKFKLQDGTTPTTIIGKRTLFNYFEESSQLPSAYLVPPSSSKGGTSTEVNEVAVLVSDTAPSPTLTVDDKAIQLPNITTNPSPTSGFKIQCKVASSKTVDSIETKKNLSRKEKAEATRSFLTPGGKLRKVSVAFSLDSQLPKTIQNFTLYPYQLVLVRQDGSIARPIGAIQSMSQEFVNTSYPFNMSRSENGKWPEGSSPLELVFIEEKGLENAKVEFLPTLVR